jgi:hypothetical protein
MYMNTDEWWSCWCVVGMHELQKAARQQSHTSNRENGSLVFFTVLAQITIMKKMETCPL